MNLPATIRRICKSRRISINALALLIPLSRRQIRYYLSGSVATPSKWVVHRLKELDA